MAETKRAPSVTGGARLVVAASAYRARPGDDPPKAVVVVVVEKAERSASINEKMAKGRPAVNRRLAGGCFAAVSLTDGKILAKTRSGVVRKPAGHRQVIGIPQIP
jgi:hypothetical protein